MFQLRHRSMGKKERRIRALSRQSWRAWLILGGLLLVVWGGAAGFVWWSVRKASASDRLPAIELQANQDFTYDLSKLENGQTRFFTYPASSSERSRLLLNRDQDGKVRTAFASCTTCYSFRGQHHLKEGQFICGQCQTAMRIADQKERVTSDKGCVAVPVPFSVEKDKVTVRSQDITDGTKALAAAAAAAGSKLGAQRP